MIATKNPTQYGLCLSQRGLTLLELTVTLLILTLLTGVAIQSTSGIAEQTRFEATRERVEQIRQAILGNDKWQSISPAAMVGFVADMGRLPNCLRELLAAQDCQDPAQPLPVWQALGICSDTNQTTASDCVGGPRQWIVLYGGWRGPYLQSRVPWTDPFAFSDGWGRLGDNRNYGWRFEQRDPTTGQADTRYVLLQSLADPERPAPYHEAYPANSTIINGQSFPDPLISPQQWQIDLAQMGLSITLATLDHNGTPTTLCARLYARENQTLKIFASNAIHLAEDGAIHTVLFQFNASPAPRIAMGPVAIGIYQTANCLSGNPELYRPDVHDAPRRVLMLPGVWQTWHW